MAQERKRSRVRSVNDDACDDQAEQYDHQHIGNVTKQLSASQIVTRDGRKEVEGIGAVGFAA